MTKNPNGKYCSTREASDILGVSMRTIQLWVDSGLLEAWKTSGGHRRITRTAVEQLAAGGLTVQSASPEECAPKDWLDALLSHIKVLVIEDDDIPIKLIKAGIKSWELPIEIITAANGIEGLIRVGRESPDLMITDLKMSGADSFQLISNLATSTLREGLEIVVVTDLSSDQIAGHGGLPESVRILPKPFPFSALRDICTGILGRRSAYFSSPPIPPAATRSSRA